MERRYVRQIFACVLAGTVLVGGALALKKGDSVVSLNYVEDRFQPSAVEEGTEAADAMLQKSYNNAKKELDALQKAYTGSGDEETANYSANLGSRDLSRGDKVTLEAGAGVMVLQGAISVIHNGAVVDVTAGSETASSSVLTTGHRYLVAEDTTAEFTVHSGLARMGVEGFYVLEEGDGSAAPFVDVADNDWYAEAADYVYHKGLIAGMGDDQFAPGLSMSRAMMVTVFYRLAGSPEEQMNAATTSFTDVKDGSWYAPYVRWGADQGVTSGTGNGTFSPDMQVTRQQVAVMLYGFASRSLGLTLSGQADLSVYSDSAAVADWAQEALSWAIANDIMAGNNGQLQPEQDATRAQVAMVLKNFSEKYL